MTNASSETENSATGLMNIVGMFSYPVEQSFCESLRDFPTFSYKSAYN